MPNLPYIPPNNYFGGPFDEDPLRIPTHPHTFIDPGKADRDDPRALPNYSGPPANQFQPPADDPNPPAPVQQISDQGPAAKIPFGPVKGTLHLLPQFQNLGRIRPFGPGEWIDQGEDNWGSEETWTVPVGKQWWVVPGLWLVDGVPTHVNEDQAAEYAQQSGLNWPTFDNEKAADKFSNEREQIWERTPKGRSDMQRPLWSRPWPPR